jgi:hypothetical protein
VGDDKIFHSSKNSQKEGPGVGYRGLFLPKGLSQTWAAAYLKLCPSETFGHPTNKAPLCRAGGLGAPPRRGRIGAELVFFWGSAYVGAKHLRLLPPHQINHCPIRPGLAARSEI